MLDPIDLTRELLQIPSPTGQEDALTRRLARLCHELGLRVELQEVEAGRSNLLATRGEPEVLLCSHLDTVPPQLPVHEDEQFLYGRGACDAKGILAAMLAAVSSLVEEGLEGFGLLLLVDEEANSAGAKRANATLRLPTRHIIVGEPTEGRLAIAQKGILTAWLHTRGIAAHGAYPEAGRSAIEPMVQILGELYSADWGRSEEFGDNVLNIGLLQGGVAVNVIPERAEASVQVRIATTGPAVEQRLREIVGGRAELQIQQRTEPLVLGRLAGISTTVAGFGTDLPYLTSFGERYLLGPGSILDAHTTHEKVAKQDLLRFGGLYAGIVRNLLRNPES